MEFNCRYDTYREKDFDAMLKGWSCTCRQCHTVYKELQRTKNIPHWYMRHHLRVSNSDIKANLLTNTAVYEKRSTVGGMWCNAELYMFFNFPFTILFSILLDMWYFWNVCMSCWYLWVKGLQEQIKFCGTIISFCPKINIFIKTVRFQHICNDDVTYSSVTRYTHETFFHFQ